MFSRLDTNFFFFFFRRGKNASIIHLHGARSPRIARHYVKHTARQAVTGSALKIESLIHLRRHAVRERGRTEVRNLRLRESHNPADSRWSRDQPPIFVSRIGVTVRPSGKMINNVAGTGPDERVVPGEISSLATEFANPALLIEALSRGVTSERNDKLILKSRLFLRPISRRFTTLRSVSKYYRYSLAKKSNNFTCAEQMCNDERKRGQSRAKRKGKKKRKKKERKKKKDKTMKQFNNTNARWAGKKVCTRIYRCSSKAAGSSTWKDLRYARPNQSAARMQMIQDYRH
ncbi:hypothetical protein PUN28_010773 [Cardiocondyla obscurior]|uniref:Ribosomal protein S11 n=1 Tax=Cardiocondyla obscurior TaxID=286306 RepID=A0AAW2FNF4_9HYME